MARVAALIPARDEAPRIGAVIEALRAQLPGVPVLVVDSGSMDETGAIARAAGARVLRQRTLGYAGALAEGYVELRRWGIERVVQLDADGQHPAGRARTLLAGLREADLVIGCRDDGACGTAGAMHRALGRQLLSSLIRRTCGVATRDPTSGFWALGPRALEAFSA